MTKKKKIKKAVLPVAGLGTRFFPATRAQPKEMLPVVDKPVVQYIVEECIQSGIEEIIFVTGRNKRAIEDHFDYLPEFEEALLKNGMFESLKEFDDLRKMISFTYVRQDKQLGNGHALLCAEKAVNGQAFVFCNADDLIYAKEPAIRQMLRAYYKNEIVEEMIGVIEVAKQQVVKCGVIKASYPDKKDREVFEVEAIVEKPKIEKAPSNLANPGRYILTPSIFEALRETEPGIGGEIWISDAFSNLGKNKPIYACRIEGKRYDCGNKLEYLKAVVDFAKMNGEFGRDFRRWLEK
ncbi:MAG: NTP transferase domain-containing protein [Candidatus Moranbacteria bacterium]|nr:NTP transferase domain-containing protein [Candidatus Moranbacteria bacterium]